MKIVHCLFSMKTGGSQILTVDILNTLCVAHDVALIVVNDQFNDALLRQIDKRVSIYFTNRKEGSRNPLPVLHLNLLLSRLRPDIIHCHERKMIRLIKYRAAKIVYTIHDVNIPTDTFPDYDALIAISDAVASDVRSRCQLPVDIVHNGIAMQAFRRRTSHVIEARRPVRIVQVSRLMHEKKGQDILIKAVAKLIHQLPRTDIQLDFVGDGVSKEYLETLARSEGVEPFVNFLGERDRIWIREYLADYHVLAQPSRYEGFGLTVVEGFAAGLPVVASDIEGPAEIIRGLPAGTLFASADVDACADALLHWIDAYRSGQVGPLVSQTYASIESRYSATATVQRYLTLYQQLVKTNRTFSLLRRVPGQYFQQAL